MRECLQIVGEVPDSDVSKAYRCETHHSCVLLDRLIPVGALYQFFRWRLLHPMKRIHHR